jgi:hypothetical protein
LTLESYPVVDDFVVRLIEREGVKFVELASAARGRLAWFPAWEHADRDLRHFVAADVPIGTFDRPYDDADENWTISIFEQGGWVYVDENDSRFRVPTPRYLAAWAALIDSFNPITPLDATSDATSGEDE